MLAKLSLVLVLVVVVVVVVVVGGPFLVVLFVLPLLVVLLHKRQVHTEVEVSGTSSKAASPVLHVASPVLHVLMMMQLQVALQTEGLVCQLLVQTDGLVLQVVTCTLHSDSMSLC